MSQEMPELRTSRGMVNWQLGHLETSERVFLYGYCANFARVLLLRRPELELCVLFNDKGDQDHYLCRSKDGSYLDVRGRLTEDEVLGSHEGWYIYDGIELDELEQDWDEEYDYLAESVMDQYLAKIGM